MSTRSIVGVSMEDGAFYKGRYVHSDGYPSYQGKALHRLLTETFKGDLAAMIQTLNHKWAGWSCLDPDAGTDQDWRVKNLGVKPGELGIGYNDGRFAMVKGVGVAYVSPEQIEMDDWRYSNEDDDTEWAYAIHADSGMVDVYAGFGANKTGVASVNLFDPGVDWQAIEDKGNGR